MKGICVQHFWHRRCRCLCRFKWVTVAVFPALSSETFNSRNINASTNTFQIKPHYEEEVALSEELQRTHEKISRAPTPRSCIYLATCSCSPCGELPSHVIVILILLLLFFDIPVTAWQTQWRLFSRASHRSVVFLIRVARTYLSKKALERCSAAGTVPFVLKMAKSEISRVGGDMNKSSQFASSMCLWWFW